MNTEYQQTNLQKTLLRHILLSYDRFCCSILQYQGISNFIKMYFLRNLKLGTISGIRRMRNVCFSTQSAFHVERLKKRTILSLSGPDTTNYLQSMVTNDVKKVEDYQSLYSLLMNPNGRVLYDTLLYKVCDTEYLVEYDKTGYDHLHRHLLMYRLRKDVKIQPITEMSAWVIYKPYEGTPGIVNSQELSAHLKDVDGIIKYADDPRTNRLGIRIVTKNEVNLHQSLSFSGLNLVEGDSYKLLRYKLGIGEGVLDHPPGNCLPFETNVDLLNGVSFTKGCYIGQEMAAKSNFVLSIRKRLMPVILEEKETYPVFPPECNIRNDKGQKVGRLRSHLGRYGLGLLKYEDCKKSAFLQLEGFDIKVEAVVPEWWPSDVSSNKNEHIFSFT